MIKRYDRAVLVVAIVVLAYLFYESALLASRVIDGTRYWLLDDDMMISMRYGRNLAEGAGLVWNAGERVEGYTNFLWTLVMAGVHLLKPADAVAALYVKAIGFAFMACSFALSVRLLRLFAPRSLLAPPLLLACMVTCPDVLHWSVWGFESSLMTFLNLAFLCRVLDRGPTRWRVTGDVLAYLALALVPLTRGDGVYVFAADAVVALLLSPAPARTALALGAAAVPLVAHFLGRHAYYGAWFPNTYYLKVYKLDDPLGRGYAYARSFLLRYAVVLALAAGSALAIALRDRRGAAFFVLVGSTVCWITLVGGDMFGNFRFCAHVMPIIFVFAAAGLATVAQRRVATLVWATVVALVSLPLQKSRERLLALDNNGDPIEQLQVAMLVRKNARPDSSIAVIAAGIVPYFTRLRAVDILGKSDPVVARLAPYPGAMVGHGKLDARHTLGELKPDLVVSCRADPWVRSVDPGVLTPDPVLRFLGTPEFQETYRPQPIEEDFLLSRTALYVHPESKESAHRRWKGISIRP